MLQKAIHSNIDEENEDQLFQRRLLIREKKNLRKTKMLEGKTTGRWDNKEQEKYYVFLMINKNHFEETNMRRSNRIFKMMSNFITTRTPQQCRTHHQKLQLKLPGIKQILQKLSKQFQQIHMKEIFENYKTLSAQTLDVSNFQNERLSKNNHDIELFNVVPDMLSAVLSNNSSVIQKQNYKIIQSSSSQEVNIIPFFGEEEDIFEFDFFK